MKKTFLLIMTLVLLTGCRSKTSEENAPTSIPPAKSTHVPTMVPSDEDNQPSSVVSYNADFEMDNGGYFAAFADYPRGQEELYELSADVMPIPDVNSKGYMLSGSSSNQDLLMYITRGFEALPKENYSITISFDLFTNIPTDSMGLISNASRNVFIKTAASNIPLASIVDSQDTLRVNWDIGNQDIGGTEGNTLGDVQKLNSMDSSYQIKKFSTSYNVKSNDDGVVYIMIGIDSGYDQPITVYIDNVIVEILQVK